MTELLPLISAVLLILSCAYGSSICPVNCNCQDNNEKAEMFCAHNWTNNLWHDWQIKMSVFRDTLELTCKDGTPSEDVHMWASKRKTNEEEEHPESIRVVTLSNCPLPAKGAPIKDSLSLESSVKKLNLKSCGVQDLQRSHFNGLSASLTHLSLIKCNIHSLPADVFQDLGLLLEELDLHENLFEAVPSNSLAHLKKLKYLELGNNKIQEITDGSFMNLPSLKFLNLWGNKNIQLFNDSLSGLKNLTSLDLGDCSINSLPERLFFDLSKLQNISLVANNFTTLPKRLFLPTDLKVLKMFHNRKQLQVPDSLLTGLRNLEKVHMQANGIVEVPENLIWDSPNISELELQQNKLKGISQTFLLNASHLVKLDLSENYLESLPLGLFSMANKLATINLSHNRISTLKRGVLQGLSSLSFLDMSHNQLTTIEANAFPEHLPLKHLDFTHNKLKDLSASKAENGFGRWSVFHNLLNLEELILSHNYVGEIYADWHLNIPSLHKLDLSYNNISKLTAGDLHFLSGNLIVDLRHTNLTNLDLKNLDILARANPNTVNIEVLLQENEVDCGCMAYDFLKYVEGSADAAVYKMMKIDVDDVTCLSTQRPVSEAKSHDVVCDSCCLPPWSCKIRRWDYAWIMQCDGCWVDGKKPPKPSKFSCRHKIRHIELHLHNNEFTTIPKEVLLLHRNITALHLSHNKLSEMKASDLPPQLKILEIDHNNLNNLDNEIVKIMIESTHLNKIALQANPWECNCDTKKLLQFLQDEYTKVMDRGNITCKNGRPLAQLTNDELCPLPKMAIIISSVILALMGIAVGLLAFLYHRYQQELKVWLYARNLCLWFVTEEELDRDKRYDAFVSYSHKDEDFVVGKLVAGLEDGPLPFKLCLHYRDWVAGDWITEQIARSIEQSRRTLVVLSPSFLESVWGKMEFRAAHRKALSEGRARVIVVMYGEVGDVEKLDPELKAYLSTNTYVKWGDPWFWDKLRYALPHSQKLQGTVRNRIVSDKMELIVPSTPSPLVTPTADISNPLEKQRHCNMNGYSNSAFTPR